MLTPHVRREKYLDETELFDNLKSNLAPLSGSAGWLRDDMTRDDGANYRPLVAALQLGPWYVGRIVLVGDSVHATMPHRAPGAGVALESAIVLADEILSANSVSEGLAAYQDRRFERYSDVEATGVDLGKLQLSGGSPEQIGRMIGGALHRLAGEF
jgi:2-polyprenyl-6-methoxyphenol hydroxylase-like FAD-dependent oxidoreductase